MWRSMNVNISLPQVALCRYTLSISVPALCADLRMLPRRRDPAKDEIRCHRVEPADSNVAAVGEIEWSRLSERGLTA